MWNEDWKTHADTKPKGPMAVSFDATFHGVENVYGIPEHATKLSLPNTKPDTEPYRLFNLDVFEYELDNPMALYGSIPFMVGHRAHQTTGLFFLNSAEMWVDVEKSHTNSVFSNMLRRLQEVVVGPAGDGDVPTTNTHWIAESGILDVFVMVGPKPADVFRQYAALTGLPSMPPLFAIAYHQCRWNYNDENDVLEVRAFGDVSPDWPHRFDTFLPLTHIYVYTHTRAHTYNHTHTHTCIHSEIHYLHPHWHTLRTHTCPH